MQMINESINQSIQIAENAKLSEQINISIKLTLNNFKKILDSIDPHELDSSDDKSQVMKSWNGKNILVSNSYLLLFKNMMVTIQEN